MEAIRGLDTNPAKYTVSDSSTMSTPSINKFYYDRDVKDVGFHPSHQAYQGTYSAGFDKFGNHYNTSMVAPYSGPSNYWFVKFIMYFMINTVLCQRRYNSDKNVLWPLLIDIRSVD